MTTEEIVRGQVIPQVECTWVRALTFIHGIILAYKAEVEGESDWTTNVSVNASARNFLSVEFTTWDFRELRRFTDKFEDFDIDPPSELHSITTSLSFTLSWNALAYGHYMAWAETGEACDDFDYAAWGY